MHALCFGQFFTGTLQPTEPAAQLHNASRPSRRFAFFVLQSLRG